MNNYQQVQNLLFEQASAFLCFVNYNTKIRMIPYGFKQTVEYAQNGICQDLCLTTVMQNSDLVM